MVAPAVVVRGTRLCRKIQYETRVVEYAQRGRQSPRVDYRIALI